MSLRCLNRPRRRRILPEPDVWNLVVRGTFHCKEHKDLDCKDHKVLAQQGTQVLDTQRLQKIMVITRTWIRVTKRIWMVMMLTVIMDRKITTRIKMILIVTRIWMTKTTTMNLEEQFSRGYFIFSRVYDVTEL